jgi:hypothetical protein
MSHPGLDRSGVVAGVCQGIAAPVSEHVGGSEMAPSTVSERSHIATFFRSGQIRCFWSQNRAQAGACFPNKNFRTRGDSNGRYHILVAAAGLAVGLRFNVIILALLVLLVITSILATGFWVGSNSRVVTLRLLATLASVQISYIVGCLIAAHIPTRVKTDSGSV